LDRGAIIDPIVKDVIDSETYVILNKEDAIPGNKDLGDIVGKVEIETGAKKVWTMSCTTGQGVDNFLKQMIDILKEK
jgi:tRNA modification GTPase